MQELWCKDKLINQFSFKEIFLYYMIDQSIKSMKNIKCLTYFIISVT